MTSGSCWPEDMVESRGREEAGREMLEVDVKIDVRQVQQLMYGKYLWMRFEERQLMCGTCGLLKWMKLM